ncbi:MAG: hypothetical protein QOK15_624 [Nocardioidaceae bacterium]|jgi:hypothetical protein|nr:hypothetical protein [Nocardioidaceae bacterium]
MRTHRYDNGDWSRRSLLVVLALGCLAAASLLTGLGLAVHGSLTHAHARHVSSASTANSADARDEIARRPYPSVDPSAAQPGALSTFRFAVLRLPPPTVAGPARVATGFPRTEEGALAQLAAIDQSALQSASVPEAQRIITAWAAPRGPTAASWSGVRGIAALLGSAGLPATGSPTLVVAASPEMGLIRGAVGSEYVVACVDFVVTATLTQTTRTAAADCQRLEWVHRRWVIGPGTEPAQAPSVWPGTDAAHEVGWRELRDD